MISHLDVMWWPFTASDFAAQVDWLFAALLLLGSILTVPALFFLIYFCVKYYYTRPADRSHPPPRKIPVELAWTLIPFFMTIGIFVWATRLYYIEESMPAKGLDISVVAKQWMFKFQHPGGQRELNELHVPVGQVIKLDMTSQDVIHDFYVPALRIKQDILPGRTTGLWFKATRVGVYKLDCAEFCGSYHSKMGSRLVVMTAKDYQTWLRLAGVDLALAAQGARLFRSLGCSGCHMDGGRSQAGGRIRAPSLAGVYGSPVMLKDGTTVMADEAYIRDSILHPGNKIVAGYKNKMPSYAGHLSEADLIKLVAYVQSLAVENANAIHSPASGR